MVVAAPMKSTMKIVGGLRLEQFLTPQTLQEMRDLGMYRDKTAVERARNKGDLPVEWDPTNPQEVKLAREVYDAAMKKGFKAFAGTSRSHKQISAFDPSVGSMLLAAPMAGGQEDDEDEDEDEEENGGVVATAEERTELETDLVDLAKELVVTHGFTREEVVKLITDAVEEE